MVVEYDQSSSSTKRDRSPSIGDKYPWALYQRMIMVSTAFFVSILMSGVTIGHVAIRELILNSKDYLCTSAEEMRRGTACYNAELALGRIYMYSAIFVMVLTYPIGWALDAHGPRFTSMFGCVVFGTGVLLLALSNLDLGWLHLIGYSVLGAGGAFVYVPSLQLCRILPKLSGLSMAFMTSAFDMSAIVFVILDWIYVQTGSKISVGWIMASYVIVPIITFILVTSFYPDGDIPIPDDGKRSSSRRFSWTAMPSNFSIQTNRYQPRNIRGILSKPVFYLATFFIGIVTSRFTSFVATLPLNLSVVGIDWRTQRIFLSGFKTFFPLAGFISMTAVGQLLQSFSLTFNILILWMLMAFVWEPLKSSPSHDVQAASLVIGSLLRPYFYSITNQLFEGLFGSRNGWVYGLSVMIAAVFNMPSLYQLYEGGEESLTMLPLFFKYVKACLNLGFILPVYLYYTYRGNPI